MNTQKLLNHLKKNAKKLRLPDEKDNLIVNTDASDKYWAAILKTDLNEICRYSSEIFNQAGTNYTTNEKELLAIIKEIKKFSLFLLSKKFIVEIDNSQVAGLVKNKLPPESQYRRFHIWQAYLAF